MVAGTKSVRGGRGAMGSLLTALVLASPRRRAAAALPTTPRTALS